MFDKLIIKSIFDKILPMKKKFKKLKIFKDRNYKYFLWRREFKI